MKRLSKYYQFGKVIRIIFDVIIVNISLFMACFTKFIIDYIKKGRVIPLEPVGLYLNYFKHGWLGLTIVVLFIFISGGVYSRITYFDLKNKVRRLSFYTIASYLLLIFYFFILNKGYLLSRSIILISGIFTIILLIVSRIISYYTKFLIKNEVREGKLIFGKKIKEVLVIGGAGYIGSVLLRKLLRDGYYVTVLDKLLYSDLGIKDLVQNGEVRLIEGDIRNVQDVTRAIKYVDAIIHLGAIVGDPACDVDGTLAIEINHYATKIILDAAKGFGIKRFIFASTCSVYGASDSILDEHSPVKPLSVYAKSKVDSEKLILSASDNNMVCTVLRFSTVFGYSPRPRFDLVVNLLTARALKENKIEIFGGNQWRPFIHVKDVSEAIIKVLNSDEKIINGAIFNVGDDSMNYQISEVANIIKEYFPSAVLIEKELENDKRNYRIKFEKIKKELGFSAAYRIEDGVLEIKRAFENNLIDDYRDPKYSNFKTISDELNNLKTNYIEKNHLYFTSR